MARALDARGFDYRSAREIWDEIRTLCEGARGMTWERLDERGLQWPCPSETHPGTSLLHADAFPSGERAPLQPIECRPTPETPSTSFPFTLITGRSLYQFNCGTMTGRTRNNELRPTDTLDISPEDAAMAGIGEGDGVHVTSAYGNAVLPAHITGAVAPGQLYATFQRPDLRVNAVTGPHRDPVTGTPEYKITAVRVERCEETP
jgi:formate dehydrogenase major subunit